MVDEVDEEGEVVAEVTEDKRQDNEKGGYNRLPFLVRALAPFLLLVLRVTPEKVRRLADV